VGSGTTFSVLLPSVPPAAASNVAAEQEKANAAAGMAEVSKVVMGS